MEERLISTKRTARYLISGEPGANVAEIIIACHGYAQSIHQFAQFFDVLAREDRLVVFPEGLSRLYQRGFSGSVGASWMTRERREDEIRDYITFLDNICDELLATIGSIPAIKALGFSQGAATASRWCAFGSHPAASLTLWAGMLPPDLPPQELLKSNSKIQLNLVCGKEDQFISIQDVEAHVSYLKKNSLNVESLWFSGGHTIDPDTLPTLFN